MQAEALVGVWLVSGYARRGAWVAGFSLFAVLAGVSLYLAAIGQPSCGCFGRIRVSPWTSLGLDLVCLVSLAVTKPTRLGTQSFLPTAVGSFAVAVLLITPPGKSVERLVARLRGEALMVSGGDADVGTAARGEVRVANVTLENLTDGDIRLVGGTADCACVATEDLPLVVPAGGQATVRVGIKFTGEPGRFKYAFHW